MNYHCDQVEQFDTCWTKLRMKNGLLMSTVSQDDKNTQDKQMKVLFRL